MEPKKSFQFGKVSDNFALFADVSSGCHVINGPLGNERRHVGQV